MSEPGAGAGCRGMTSYKIAAAYFAMLQSCRLGHANSPNYRHGSASFADGFLMHEANDKSPHPP